jgi:hypothetical protein
MMVTLAEWLVQQGKEPTAEAGYVAIENVAIPLRLGERFIAPDLEAALRYYPKFLRYSGTGWTVQAYLSRIVNYHPLKRVVSAAKYYEGD